MIKDLVKFNINEHVWVKLTPRGRAIYKANHEAFRRNYPDLGPVPEIKENEDGFSQWQLWVLMSEFGDHISMGKEQPFETGILLEITE